MVEASCCREVLGGMELAGSQEELRFGLYMGLLVGGGWF
jgi:hypothetical protein